MSKVDKDGRIHETTTEARGATGSKDTRNILVVATILVVIIFVVVVLVGRP
jgi:hypothetical protein